MTITVSPEPVTSRDARRLLAQLVAYLTALYPPGTDFGDLPEEEVEEGGVFLVARTGSVAVGCGALRPLSADEAEVKRMFVVPSARRAGVARRLLTDLEDRARAGGCKRLVLATGSRQAAALALYASAGYRRASPPGQNRGWPYAVWLEKYLPPPSP